MQLQSISYEEYAGQPRRWALEKSTFGAINLVVGRNSSGKSRFINLISGLAGLLQEQVPHPFISGDYELNLLDKGTTCILKIGMQDKRITHEALKIDGKTVISRDQNGAGFIWAEGANTQLQLKIPPDKLVCVSRRDEIQHPFIEYIQSWAASVRRYPFGSELGQRLALAFTGQDLSAAESIMGGATDPNKVVEVYVAAFNRFGKKFDTAVLKDFARIGYNCSAVNADQVPELQMPNAIPIMLSVQERDLPSPTRQIEMSSGMFRALALIIHINFTIMSKGGSCILIDDIGEGLDFERATRLIDLVIEKCKRHKFQLFMSTNDRIVMNDVDLKYWHIAERTGNQLRMLNHNNSKRVFDNFKFLGLNNFDFFASKAYLGHGADEENRDFR